MYRKIKDTIFYIENIKNTVINIHNNLGLTIQVVQDKLSHLIFSYILFTYKN